MKTEFEAKFYPVDKDAIRRELRKIGAKKVQQETKMRRTIFDINANPSIKATYIRVRDEGSKIRLSAKINAKEDGNLNDQKEVDTIVDNFDDTIEILEAAGLIVSNYQENLRETWDYNGVEVVIDTWPSLEPYIEIEAGSGDEVKEVARVLGENWDNRRITSVVEIYMEVYNLDREEVLRKLENLTFENSTF